MTDKKEFSFSWLQLIKAIYTLLGKHRLRFFALTLFLITLHFNAILTPLLLGKIVDFFTKYVSGQSLNEFYIYVGIIGGLQILVSYLRLGIKQAMAIMQSNIGYELRVQGFQRLMDLSLAWHDSEISGNKFQRVQNGTMQFRQILRMLNNEIYSTIVSIVGMIMVFAFMQPLYIVVVLLYLCSFAFMLKHFYEQTIKLQNQQNEAMENASGAYVEGLGNILSIKASGAQSKFTQSISHTEDIRKQFEQKIARVSIQKWRIYQMFTGVIASVFLVLIGKDVASGLLSVGSILIVYSYVQQLVGRAGDILDMYEQIITAKSSVGRMMTILDSKEIPQGGSKKFPEKWQKITLENINFSYSKPGDDSKEVPGLKNVSIELHRNQKIGIVGKTGSGKSTIAKILLGLYPINLGHYTIGNENFSEISHASLTKHMSMVLQDSEMFNMSVRENITLMRNISEETLLQSIKIAQLESVIAKLPQGLETLIGEKGYHLSGGERQRVGIARAICQDPEIIIFDEATSSLDSQTEQKIQMALEKELSKKTLIFIAHRISTLKNADVIYVFESGEIIESGTYTNLIRNKKSLFSKLYTIQERSSKS